MTSLRMSEESESRERIKFNSWSDDGGVKKWEEAGEAGASAQQFFS